MTRDEPGAAHPAEPPGYPPEPPVEAVGYREITLPAVRVARRLVTSPFLQGLTALAIYLAIMLSTKLDQLLAHPSVPRLSGSGLDPGFYVWMLRWWPYAISHLSDPLHTSLISAPGAANLAWTSSVPTLAVLAAPLTETVGPVATYNLLTVLAIPLTAWAAFLFCRRLTGRFWPSLAGGAVFGFSGYEVSNIPSGDIDLTYGVLLPVVGYLVLLWWQGAIGRVLFVVLAGLAIAGQFYLFLETFADLTAMLIVALVAGYLLSGHSFRPRVARLAGLLAIGYGLALVLAAPYLHAALENVPRAGIFVIHAHPLDLVAMKPDIPLYAIAVALVLLQWSSRFTRYLAVMLVVIIAAALGPTLTIDGRQEFGLPWGGIWRLPFAQDAQPKRLIVFGYLALAVMTAIFLAGPAKTIWAHWSRWLLAAPIAAVMAVNMAVVDGPATMLAAPHSELPAFISSGHYRRVLSPGETVAVVSGAVDAGMLWQAETGYYFRLAGGYVSFPLSRSGSPYGLPVQIQELARISRRTTGRLVAIFRQYVISKRVGALLIQVNSKPWWVKFLPDIGLRGHVMGGVLIYPTDGCRACVDPLHRHHHKHRLKPGKTGVADLPLRKPGRSGGPGRELDLLLATSVHKLAPEPVFCGSISAPSRDNVI
jgi:hypothetical protein